LRQDQHARIQQAFDIDPFPGLPALLLILGSVLSHDTNKLKGLVKQQEQRLAAAEPAVQGTISPGLTSWCLLANTVEVGLPIYDWVVKYFRKNF
jgi:hypothetical protein